MGTTKIINILKSDSFDDIFEEFKKAQAEEVIFILPKNSRVGRNESHFVSLASEAQASQKNIILDFWPTKMKTTAPTPKLSLHQILKPPNPILPMVMTKTL